MSGESLKQPWVLILASSTGATPDPERLAASGAGDLLGACWRVALGATRSEKVFVLCSEDLEVFVLDYTPGLVSENLILEPSARSTGPAMVLAMVHMALAGATTHDPVLVLRADAVVDDDASLLASVGRAMEACLEHPALITFATSPQGLDNTYGWLGLGPVEQVADRGAGDASDVCRVLQVKVDPDHTEAAQYRDSGKWRWATGMLAFRHGYMGYVLGEVCDEFDVAMLLAGCIQQADMSALADEYALMPALSFEESVLLGAPNVLSVELRCGWQQARSWGAPALAEA